MTKRTLLYILVLASDAHLAHSCGQGMEQNPAALQIRWLAGHCLNCERRIFFGAPTLPDWRLLSRIVGLSRTPAGALGLLWQKEWQRALDLITSRSFALPRALRNLLREVGCAGGGPASQWRAAEVVGKKSGGPQDTLAKRP